MRLPALGILNPANVSQPHSRPIVSMYCVSASPRPSNASDSSVDEIVAVEVADREGFLGHAKDGHARDLALDHDTAISAPAARNSLVRSW